MAQKLNEDVVNRLIDGIFDWVRDGREKALAEKFRNDPQLVSMTNRLSKLKSEIKEYLETHN